MGGVIAKNFAGLSLFFFFIFLISNLDKSFANEVNPCSAFKLSKHIFPTSERCVALLCLCTKKIEVLFSMGMFYN